MYDILQISSDMTMLDIDVPQAFQYVSNVGLEILGVIVIIAVVTKEVLIVALPLLLVVRWLQVISFLTHLFYDWAVQSLNKIY